MEKQKVIDTIAKLMALAMNDGATDAEKANAMQKAQHIMVKHNIAQAEVMSKEKVEHNGASRTNVNMFDSDEWEKLLGWSIARVFDCKAVGFNNQMLFFGMKDDLDLAIYFYNRLLRYISSMGRQAYSKGYKNKIRSYCRGCQTRVSERLTELYKKVTEELPVECLALVVVKEKVIDNKILNDIGGTRNARVGRRPDMEAFKRGMEDGDSIPLHSNRTQVKNSG